MKIQREPRYEVEQYLLPQELYTSGPMLLSKIIGDATSTPEQVKRVSDIVLKKHTGFTTGMTARCW